MPPCAPVCAPLCCPFLCSGPGQEDPSGDQKRVVPKVHAPAGGPTPLQRSVLGDGRRSRPAWAPLWAPAWAPVRTGAHGRGLRGMNRGLWASARSRHPCGFEVAVEVVVMT
jgi:hypothetical protein